jgi:hypothetical protein
MRELLAACALVMVGAILTGTAGADTRPIGPLPSGPTTTIIAERGSLIAIALPRQRRSTGLVWRIARPVDSGTLQQASEADVGTSVVVVFRSVGRGSARVVFALTRGESSAQTVRASVYRVYIR